MRLTRQTLPRSFSAATTAVLFLAACASSPQTPRPWLDFAALQRATTPNDALACSTDICLEARPSTALFEFDVDAAAIGEAIRRIEPSAELRAEPNGDIRARYVATTSVLRFKDDVDVLIRPSGPETSRMAVYSHSRIGVSDLGTNARRIEDLERRIRADLSAVQP